MPPATHARRSRVIPIGHYGRALIRIAGAGLCLAALAGCRARPAVGAITHPTAENIVPDDRLASVIDRSAPTADGSTAARLVENLAHLRRGLTIGSPDGARGDAFSRIVDATLTEAGGFLVLDRTLALARSFDADGRYVNDLRGAAGDPFRSVEVLADLPGDRVVVMDRSSTYPLKIFVLDGGTYRISRQVPVQVWPEDMCSDGRDLFVLGLARDEASPGQGVVHRYTTDGALRASFGPVYRSELPIARKQMSQGVLACLPEQAGVLLMFKRLPYVYAFDADGRSRWISRIGDFMPPAITEGPREFHVSGKGTFDLPTAIVPLSRDHVLLQITRVNRKDGLAEPRSYLIESATGRGAYLGTALPAVIGGRWPRLIALEREPHEHIVAYDAK